MNSTSSRSPKIVYITAGAGGMYCGSCIRDNALATALGEQGWDITLLPLYTPIRTDDEDKSIDRLFFGGINVYLQEKIPLFRHLPGFLDRWLDNPRLIRRVASRAMSVDPAELGSLSLSMVRGEHGHQKKEVMRLLAWLRDVARPDLICLTNLLVGGSIPVWKRELGIPVLVTLQGDDVFLDELEEPWHGQVLAEMKKLAEAADGFLTFTPSYRDAMATLFEVPEEKFHLTPLGIEADEFSGIRERRQGREPGRTIGYFARICPEKGFDLLVDAFLELARRDPGVTLRAGGWLSPEDRAFYEAEVARIEAAGLAGRFDYAGAVGPAEKADFLSEIDVFCVPARFHEPKGLYVLEALACGLPVVAPDRGAFLDMVEPGRGGSLFRHDDAGDLAVKLDALLSDPTGAASAGESGYRWVAAHCSRERMAEATGAVFARYLDGGNSA